MVSSVHDARSTSINPRNGLPGIAHRPGTDALAAGVSGTLRRWSEAAAGLPDTPASRLARLRRHAGYEAAADAARAMGANLTTYWQHENGTRKLSNIAADRYAAFFRVDPGLILYGERAPPPPRRVPVVGAVMLHGRIRPRMEYALDVPETVAAPPGAGDELQALVVLEDDLAPAYRAGDVVFYAAPGPLDAPAATGRECVVETDSGERRLCLCEPDAQGSWTLRSYRGKPAHRVRLRSAAPVLWVQRAAVPTLSH